MDQICSCVFQPKLDPADVDALSDGINAYAAQYGMQPIESFGFFMKTREGKVQGGITCYKIYGFLHIDQLWVEEKYRKSGKGKELILKAENLGREKGCMFASVNTMNWEALSFYRKLGYEVEFTREGFEGGASMFFLRKSLT